MKNIIIILQTWGQLGYEELTFSCTVKEYFDKNPLTTYLTIGSGVPLIIISYCYFCIYCKVIKNRNSLLGIMDKDVVDANLTRQMDEREAAITKTTFLVCMLILIVILIINVIMIQGMDWILHLFSSNIFNNDRRSNATQQKLSRSPYRWIYYILVFSFYQSNHLHSMQPTL